MFISYAHEQDSHNGQVRDLWAFLRSCGIDAKLDVAAAGQRQDWALWTAEQVREADHVLVIASLAYRQRARGSSGPNMGRGAQWEARLIRDAFYRDQHALIRFLPVVLPGQTIDGIPDFLAAATATVYYVREFTVVGAEPLLRLLTGQPTLTEPALGTRPVLDDHEPALPIHQSTTAKTSTMSERDTPTSAVSSDTQSAKYAIDARGAVGVQVGERNIQTVKR